MKFEANIIIFLQSVPGSEHWLTFFKFVTLFGSWLGIAIAFLILFLKKKSLGVAYGLTTAIGVGFNSILKVLIKRPRPFETWQSILNLGGSTGASMPSGHTNSATLLAVFISYMAIKYGKNRATKVCVPIIMALFVALVGLSRIYLGQHYLTDVIAGAVEGFIIAVVGIVLYNFILKRMGQWRNR